MEDYERLRRLVAQGDVEASTRLKREAQRRGDEAGWMEAVAALGDSAALVVACAQAWGQGRWEACARAARWLGFGLDEATCEGLDGVLGRAQAGVRGPRLERRHVLEAIHAARASPHGVAYRTAEARGGRAVCLAARTGSHHLRVGVAACNPRYPTPGSGWRELRPWRREVEENAARAAGWAQFDDEDRWLVEVWPLGEALREASAPAGRWARLEGLVSGEPSAQAWSSALRLLGRWPVAEEATRARARAAAALEAWPDAARLGGRGWLRSMRAQRPRAELGLCRHLEAELSTEEVEALARLEGAGVLRELSVRLRCDYRLSRVMPRNIRGAVEALVGSTRLVELQT